MRNALLFLLLTACDPAQGFIDDDTSVYDTGHDTADTADTEDSDTEDTDTDSDTGPNPSLRVELTWEIAGDGMDLHLLAPGGVIEGDLDCYYANCIDWGQGTLDWGTDDPELDTDDQTGVGPENITIESTDDGAYTVVVHDYPGQVYIHPDNVTIKVYFDEALVWTDTKSVNDEDSYTYFASIDTSSGIITPL